MPNIKFSQLKIKTIVALLLLTMTVIVFMYGGRVFMVWQLSGKANIPQCNDDYILAMVELKNVNPTSIQVYNGLPHYYWDSKRFRDEVYSSNYFTVLGYPFYDKAVNIESSKLIIHTESILNTNGYSQYGGPKACGGYHADFAIKLLDNNIESWLLYCLGCHEVIFIDKEGRSFIFEMNKELYIHMKSFSAKIRPNSL